MVIFKLGKIWTLSLILFLTAALLGGLALLPDRRAELARLRLHRGGSSGHVRRDARRGLLLGSHARPDAPRTFFRCTWFEVQRVQVPLTLKQ